MTSRVDILRHPTELPPDTGQRLQLWLHANQLDPSRDRWPLRIDWPQQGITYWPDGTDKSSSTQTLMQSLRGRLWAELADAGALWCADPAHDTAESVPCPHLIGRNGQHLPAGPEWRPWDQPTDPLGRFVPKPASPADDAVGEAIRFALTIVIERAVRTCDHPHPAMPMYRTGHACTACAVTAVMDLMAGPELTDQVVRARLAAAVTGELQPAARWVVGHGSVPAGDPRADEWWQPGT